MNKIISALTYILVFIVFILPSLNPVWGQADNYVIGQDYPNGLKNAIDSSQLNSAGYVTHLEIAQDAAKGFLIGPPIEGLQVARGSYKNDPQYVQKLYQNSAVAQVNNQIIAIYLNPPASTAWAIRDMGESLGILPTQVYAQSAGVGFGGLYPLLPIWKVFRNLAYLLLAIVMIVIGFMVMLRKKIDPKTVVTVQNALPRVVLALILVTFSYAIVGILIDAMYLLIFLAVSILMNAGLPNQPAGILAKYYQSNYNLYANGGIYQVQESAFPLDPSNGNWGLTSLAASILGGNGFAAGALVGGLIGTFTIPIPVIGSAIGALVGAVTISPLLGLILQLAVLFTMIRLFIMFLASYINIILSLLTGPLQLMTEAVPGVNAFSSWIKNLIANLSVFPVAAVMFMLATIFDLIATNGSTDIWTAPYLSVFGGQGASGVAIAAMFSLGIVMAIPTVCKSIKETLKAKAPVDAGPGAIFGVFGHAGTTALGSLSQSYYLNQMVQEATGKSILARLGIAPKGTTTPK